MPLDLQNILDRVNAYDITSLDTTDVMKLIRQLASEVARKCPVYCWAALPLSASVAQYDQPTTSLSGRDLSDGAVYDVFWIPGLSLDEDSGYSFWIGANYPDQVYHSLDSVYYGLRNASYFKQRQGRFELQDGKITLYPTPDSDVTIPVLMSVPRLDAEIDDDLNDAIANGVLGLLYMRESTRISQTGSFRAGNYAVTNSDHASQLRVQGKEFRDAYMAVLEQWEIEVA